MSAIDKQTLTPPEQPARRQSDEAQTSTTSPEVAEPGKLLAGLVFGVIFGFLLQKGGVAKFHVLIGQLMLVDYTVVKVMLSAVVVGSLGIHLLHRLGLVELHIKPTKYFANMLGGLIFGVGFALAAYCPGTGAAAIGQGNFDGLGMVFGMVLGSYLFAEMSGWIAHHIDGIGNRGPLTLYDWIPLDKTVVTVLFASLLCIVLAVIEAFAAR